MSRSPLRRLSRTVLLALLLFAAAASADDVRRDRRSRIARPAADPFIRQLVAQVEAENLLAAVRDLQNCVTRYVTTSGHAEAVARLTRRLVGMGLEVGRDEFPFTYEGRTWTGCNLVAEKRGTGGSDGVVILCAHYDSTAAGNQRFIFAPGADDNASGVAAILEIARILSRQELRSTVRFVALDVEEGRALGSQVYAARLRARGERVLAVINLDMIAYADALPEDVDIETNEASRWLADRLAEAVLAYTPLTSRAWVRETGLADEQRFMEQGFPTLLATEEFLQRNPNWHRRTDTYDTLSSDFFLEFTRAVLALAADLGGVVRPRIPAPEDLRAEVAVFRGLFAAFANVRLSWSAVAGAAGYNVYRAPGPGGGAEAERLDTASGETLAFEDRQLPLGTRYRYWVAAVNAGGIEGDRAEVEADVSGLPAALPEPGR